ncbi:ABC transporter permease [Leifsonia sp. LS1]|uniref:ABC transporter permease n=1 Tax=unclassified Leifsonia TaxID=2663824 RepID=UPI001CC0B56C|nr:MULTISPECIES: ABC transporter permease [unclassified Leifsonia]GIT79788.1 ABC transporter permease [Leifsonia sp. LS1]
MTAIISEKRSGNALARAWRYLASFDALTTSAMWVLTVLFLSAVLGRLLGLGGSPTDIVGRRLAPPSLEFPAGTDSLGRSLLPRLLEGITTTLLLSAVAVALTAVIATFCGIVAGYRGGKTGGTIMRVGDILYAFPAIVLAILVAAVVGPGIVAALASIVLVTVPLMTRMVGQATRQVVERDFITSAVISGVTSRTIMTRHVLRNVAGTVAVQGTYALSVAILVEGGLSFLGYGVQPPASSLGLLVQEGTVYMVTAPWLIIAPGAVLVVAILAINLIGDALRDRFDPREARRLT